MSPIDLIVPMIAKKNVSTIEMETTAIIAFVTYPLRAMTERSEPLTWVRESETGDVPASTLNICWNASSTCRIRLSML